MKFKKLTSESQIRTNYSSAHVSTPIEHSILENSTIMCDQIKFACLWINSESIKACFEHTEI